MPAPVPPPHTPSPEDPYALLKPVAEFPPLEKMDLKQHSFLKYKKFSSVFYNMANIFIHSKADFRYSAFSQLSVLRFPLSRPVESFYPVECEAYSTGAGYSTGVSNQQSAISNQLSAISYQLSVIRVLRQIRS
jgi:hypothetical protein